MRDFQSLEKFRNIEMEIRMHGHPLSSEARKAVGFFNIPIKNSRRGLAVVASNALSPVSNGWEHVSVSLPARTPTWEEMAKVKDLFFYPHEVCMQLHPAEEHYISNHKHCLHIWRHISQPIPLPPPEMVGVKDMGTLRHMNAGFAAAAQDEAVKSLTDQATEWANR